MVLWTIYIITPDGEFYPIEIDNEKTFEELKRMVSKEIGLPYEYLILAGREEYNFHYNPKKIKEIDGLSDQESLYAIVQYSAEVHGLLNK